MSHLCRATLCRTALLLGIVCGAATSDAAITFEFDYQYDTAGFFDPPERREALEMAGKLFDRYVDDLAEVTPDENNTWQSFIVDPGGNAGLQIVQDIPVAEDTVIVYVASNNIGGDLAHTFAAPGIATGTPEFEDAYHFRSQEGAGDSPATDFGVWGGSISFNSNAEAVPWYFGLEENGIAAHEFDFITVAVHELTHLMGFGTAKSYSDYITSKLIPANGNDPARLAKVFEGPEAIAVGSPSNRMLELDSHTDGQHLKDGTKSRHAGRLQDALLAPGIFIGERQFLTELDRAILRDIGWEEGRAGDANLDRIFNSADLITMFQAAKYETNQLAAWSDGDFNDNARFTSSDLTAAFAEAWYVAAATSADIPDDGPDEPVTVEYDSTNGQLRIENSHQLSTFELTSEDEQFLPAKAVSFDGPFDVSRSDKLFLLSVDGIADEVALGNVLPAGLSLAELEADLSFDGSLTQGGRLADVRLHIVPEPNYSLILVVSAILLAVRRADR